LRTRKELVEASERGIPSATEKVMLEVLLDIRNLLLTSYGDHQSDVKAALLDGRPKPVDTDVGL
jgi:hypothetical protein